MKHPKYLAGYDSLAAAALAVSNLSYDSLRDFLKRLALNIKEQGQGDKKCGREKLAKILKKLSTILNDSAKSADEAWKISEPFMLGKKEGLQIKKSKIKKVVHKKSDPPPFYLDYPQFGPDPYGRDPSKLHGLPPYDSKK